MNMIEIEVEMELQVPAEELAGIEEQMVRLEELEELREEWTIAAEAQDEVMRMRGGGRVLGSMQGGRMGAGGDRCRCFCTHQPTVLVAGRWVLGVMAYSREQRGGWVLMQSVQAQCVPFPFSIHSCCG